MKGPPNKRVASRASRKSSPEKKKSEPFKQKIENYQRQSDAFKRRNSKSPVPKQQVLKKKAAQSKSQLVEVVEAEPVPKADLEKENTLGSEPFINTVDSSHLGLSQQLKQTLKSNELISISEIEIKSRQEEQPALKVEPVLKKKPVVKRTPSKQQMQYQKTTYHAQASPKQHTFNQTQHSQSSIGSYNPHHQVSYEFR